MVNVKFRSDILYNGRAANYVNTFIGVANVKLCKRIVPQAIG